MNEYDFNSSVYNENLKKVYSPSTPDKDKEYLLKYFLAHKSETIGTGNTYQEKTADAIQYLQNELNDAKPDHSPNNGATNWQDNKIKYFIIGVSIVVIGGLILHFLTS